DCHIHLGKPWKYLHKAVYDYDRDVYHVNSGRRTLQPLSMDQLVHDMGVVKRMVRRWLKSQREKSHSKRGDEVKVVRDESKQTVFDNVSAEKNEKTVEVSPKNLPKEEDAQDVEETNESKELEESGEVEIKSEHEIECKTQTQVYDDPLLKKLPNGTPLFEDLFTLPAVKKNVDWKHMHEARVPYQWRFQLHPIEYESLQCNVKMASLGKIRTFQMFEEKRDGL